MSVSLRPPELTDARLSVLKFVAARERFPSADEISQHMGWKTNAGVHNCLACLRGMDLVDRHPYKDGRRTVWFVTKSGRDVAERAELV